MYLSNEFNCCEECFQLDIQPAFQIDEKLNHQFEIHRALDRIQNILLLLNHLYKFKCTYAPFDLHDRYVVLTILVEMRSLIYQIHSDV